MAAVREMTGADLPKVAELSGQLGYPVTLEALKKRFEALRGSKTHVLFVAGEPVGGWIQVEERHSLESGENAEIVGLVVDSGRRRGEVSDPPSSRTRAGSSTSRTRSPDKTGVTPRE